MRIILADDGNKNTSYDVPGCVYDSETPINLISIPFLREYSGRKDKIPNLDNGGTWIRSIANKSHFTWYHGQFERHFMHGASRLP